MAINAVRGTIFQEGTFISLKPRLALFSNAILTKQMCLLFKQLKLFPACVAATVEAVRALLEDGLKSRLLLWSLLTRTVFGLTCSRVLFVFLLPVVVFLLPVVVFLLPVMAFLLPVVVFLLPLMAFLLPVVVFLLPVVVFLLPVMVFLLPLVVFLLPVVVFLIPVVVFYALGIFTNRKYLCYTGVFLKRFPMHYHAMLSSFILQV